MSPRDLAAVLHVNRLDVTMLDLAAPPDDEDEEEGDEEEEEDEEGS